MTATGDKAGASKGAAVSTPGATDGAGATQACPLARASFVSHEFITECPRSDRWYNAHADCPECEGTKMVVRRKVQTAHFDVHVRSAPPDAPKGKIEGSELVW